MDSFPANNQLLIHFWVDFGSDSIDFTLGQAAIYHTFPHAKLVVSPTNIKKGHIQSQSVYLKQFIDKFPPNTVHICHLTFASSQSKRFVITKVDDQYFIGPDNGFFYLTMPNDEQEYYILPVDNFRINPLTEVYLPSLKKAIENNFELSAIFKIKSIMVKPLMVQPIIAENSIKVKTIHIDSKGNVFFNLDKQTFEDCRKNRNFVLRNHTMKITNVSLDYDDVPEGEILCMFTYGNILQVAQNAGNASEKLGLTENAFAIIDFIS